MSTVQAVNADLTNRQEAAQLWVPSYTTSGTANVYFTPGVPAAAAAPQADEKPRKKLSPLEWLDRQVTDVVALALP